ncbi:MAG TPA: BlaI/MecI/CopY family transcriptional regulator [Mycobacteriales bacterium]|nr:BlaI/MecI/CopY family transcriptional regulator [Mycobacteriales bacterium]
MTAHPRRGPGELEADVLATLWRSHEPMSPGQVRDALDAGLAYTTVMTILSRLHEKGSVTRQRAGRAFVYTPAFAQAELAASQMRALLDRGDDRDEILARFVGSLSKRDERTLASLLRRPARPRRS